MGRSHLQKGHGQYQPDRLTTSRTPAGRGKTASEAAGLRIRYEIGEIRYEQCSGAFYLLKWPFLQPYVPSDGILSTGC